MARGDKLTTQDRARGGRNSKSGSGSESKSRGFASDPQRASEAGRKGGGS